MRTNPATVLFYVFFLLSSDMLCQTNVRRRGKGSIIIIIEEKGRTQIVTILATTWTEAEWRGTGLGSGVGGTLMQQ